MNVLTLIIHIRQKLIWRFFCIQFIWIESHAPRVQKIRKKHSCSTRSHEYLDWTWLQPFLGMINPTICTQYTVALHTLETMVRILRALSRFWIAKEIFSAVFPYGSSNFDSTTLHLHISKVLGSHDDYFLEKSMTTNNALAKYLHFDQLLFDISLLAIFLRQEIIRRRKNVWWNGVSEHESALDPTIFQAILERL